MPKKAQLKFILLVAWRFLREAKAQTLLTLVGISLGVMVIVFLARLIDRLEYNMVSRVLSSQTDIVITAPEESNVALRAVEEQAAALIQPRTRQHQAISNWQNIMQQISTQPQVTAVAPLAAGTVFAVRGQVNKAVVLLGTNPQQYAKLIPMPQYMVKGDFDYAADQAVIGRELAQELGADVGDKIFLRNADGLNNMLLVSGIFDIGNRDLNARWVFVRLKEAQNLLNLAGAVSRLDVKIDDTFAANEIAAELQRRTALLASSWMVTNEKLMEALKSQSSSNVLIRSFLLLMIVVTIVSVLAISVVQKQKEIGILRAMGATQRQIAYIFLLQGALFGFIGAVIGIILAGLVMLALAVLPLDLGTIFPFIRLNLATMGGTLAVVTAAGMLAAYFPARAAAAINIITAIQR